MPARSLALLARQLDENPYSKYPLHDRRLVLPEIPLGPFGRPIIHAGPWTLDYYLPDREAGIALQAAGHRFDNLLRPLHPWFDAMVTDPAVGVLVGKGFYREYGPNYTADPIVLRGDDVLLIKRGDTGDWALPGGFLEPQEHGDQAARRECFEETGISIPDSVVGCVVYSGPVADVRMTANAWPETTAVVYRLGADFIGEPIGQDDAVGAAWVPLAVARQARLFGSHDLLLNLSQG